MYPGAEVVQGDNSRMHFLCILGNKYKQEYDFAHHIEHSIRMHQDMGQYNDFWRKLYNLGNRMKLYIRDGNSEVNRNNFQCRRKMENCRLVHILNLVHMDSERKG